MCLQTFQVSEEKQTVKRGERNPCPEGIFNDKPNNRTKRNQRNRIEVGTWEGSQSREREGEEYMIFTKHVYHHVCAVNHGEAGSSNYKYDYRRYRIVARRRKPRSKRGERRTGELLRPR